ncbi:MAG: hypothetical protein KatS3mg109_1024 [Pirellulaceae bacterium]|nr:MAG: hypothetical protein KatS3mg109_1024 [Pirellulaceae bacterium]
MTVTSSLFNGRVTNSERILHVLRKYLLKNVVCRMNCDLLPYQFALYKDERIPTNQRNLTDVRTRMGVLLEYEFAKAVNHVLDASITRHVILTYVIANRFPDLAFRTRNGGIGVRFEVKAIEAIAEEKSANFDTLIKDIRKGTDFVVVMLWEWTEHRSHQFRHPVILDMFVMDAYQLAQMRDTYWLNHPPADPGDARQGFDLCFAVNCRAGQYNQEEGNYGKLMRIFDEKCEGYLPDEVRKGSTLQEYYRFKKTTIRVGLERIGQDIAKGFVSGPGELKVCSHDLPVVLIAGKGTRRLLIVGDTNMPRKQDVLQLMRSHQVEQVLLLNGKFDWKVRNADWHVIASGRKPASAREWVSAIRRVC